MNINFSGDIPVNYPGIDSKLKGDCQMCNVVDRNLKNNVCVDCPFCFSSIYDSKKNERRIRVYPSAKVFSRYGLINLPSMGKHTLYYFQAHPELNYKFPVIPNKDLFGNVKAVYGKSGKLLYGKEFIWHIHHWNGNYWDDNEWNLLLCLNTEHNYFEAKERTYVNKAEHIILF